MKTKALDKQDRFRQIMLAFAVNLQAGGTGELTAVDVARKIGLAPSKHVRDFINELYVEGLLLARKEPMSGAVGFRWVYYPSALFDAKNGRPKREIRTLRINSKKGGQMVMFEEVDSD